MTKHLVRLSDADLCELATALRAKRLAYPYAAISLERLLSSAQSHQVASDLLYLSELGFNSDQLAATLDLMVQDRAARQESNQAIDFVTTGPEANGVSNRDTAVVVRELFAHARKTVLVAGYVVYQGQQVFQALADRMQQLPDLQVRLFLDIQRGHGDTTSRGELVKRFAERFRSQQWPKDRPIPKVFYDPRSLEVEATKKACLHAKCVVIDEHKVFVSSANFTEAAQERNIEIGLLITANELAQKIARHFEALLYKGTFSQLRIQSP